MDAGIGDAEAERDGERERALRRDTDYVERLSEEREQRAGEEAFAAAADGLDEGQPVDVTIGDKLFKPADYNGFRSGTYKASTVVRKGESVGRAMLRLHAEMAAAARVIQEREAAQYCEDLAALVRKVGGIRL